MTELRDYADIPVSDDDVEQAHVEFAARLAERTSQRKRGRLVGAAVTAATIAAVALVIALWGWTGGVEPTPPVNTPMPPSTIDGAGAGLPYLLDLTTGERSPVPATAVPSGIEIPPVYSADGGRLAYSVFDCSNGGEVCNGEKLFVAAGASKRVVQTPPGTAAGPIKWSPDGDTLLYQLREAPAAGFGTRYAPVGDLYLYDVASNSSTRLTYLELAKAWWYELSADFTQDGDAVVYHLPRNSTRATRWDVWTVPVAGGEPALLLHNASHPRYLADGSIAYLRPAPSAFDARDIETTQGDGRHLTSLRSEAWNMFVSPDRTRLLLPTLDGVRLVETASGDVFEVADGSASWVDDHTLFVLGDT